MTGIKNSQEIDWIKMYPTAYTKCVIGQDWYKNSLEIFFIPNKCYPDYMDIDGFIMKEIDGSELNIEDVVERVFAFLVDNYDPAELEVIDHIRGCKTHFNVDVAKQL